MVIWGMVYSTYLWCGGWFIGPIDGDLGDGFLHLSMVMRGMVYSTYLWWIGGLFLAPLYGDVGDGL